jgi:sugar/nucleoside kinase (ribokinase family)
VTVLCLGEAIVDLVCERPGADLASADSFVPHSGGAVANAAVVAARCGASVQLAGGVGADGWGDWLERRLRSEGVGLRWLARVPGLATPIAFIVVDEHGEPSFQVYGHGIEAGVASLAPRLEEAMLAADAVLLGSNTLVGAREREISMRAREIARSAGRPIVFDVNLRLHRWPDRAEALALMRELCEGTAIVKLNAEEARFMSGESDPRAAADAICALGCETTVVTLGADGALARGAAVADVAGVPARAIDTTGAGDVVTGVLVAALDRRGRDGAAIADALPSAVAAAARSTEGWGAVDALPAMALKA